jgi:hypothetical protein
VYQLWLNNLHKTAPRMAQLFPTNFWFSMAYNVPAVYDGLAARISKTVGFAGPTNCGGVMAWEWSEAE